MSVSATEHIDASIIGSTTHVSYSKHSRQWLMIVEKSLIIFEIHFGKFYFRPFLLRWIPEQIINEDTARGRILKLIFQFITSSRCHRRGCLHELHHKTLSNYHGRRGQGNNAEQPWSKKLHRYNRETWNSHEERRNNQPCSLGFECNMPIITIFITWLNTLKRTRLHLFLLFAGLTGTSNLIGIYKRTWRKRNSVANMALRKSF